MKKIVQYLVTGIFIVQVLLMIIGSKLGIVIIDTDVGIYMFVLSFFISVAFLKVLWNMKEKAQNIAVVCLVIAYILCFKIQIILVLGLIGIQLISRYERTTLNKVMKMAAILFMVVAVLNFPFVPALVSGYQEAGDDVYRILESEDGDNIVIISNYDTSAYGTRGYVEVSFSKKRFAFFRDEIAHHQMIYQLRMTYEWLDNDTIRIYDTLFFFENDGITVIEP